MDILQHRVTMPLYMNPFFLEVFSCLCLNMCQDSVNIINFPQIYKRSTDQQGKYRAICLWKVGRQSFAKTLSEKYDLFNIEIIHKYIHLPYLNTLNPFFSHKFARPLINHIVSTPNKANLIHQPNKELRRRDRFSARVISFFLTMK